MIWLPWVKRSRRLHLLVPMTPLGTRRVLYPPGHSRIPAKYIAVRRFLLPQVRGPCPRLWGTHLCPLILSSSSLLAPTLSENDTCSEARVRICRTTCHSHPNSAWLRCWAVTPLSPLRGNANWPCFVIKHLEMQELLKVINCSRFSPKLV